MRDFSVCREHSSVHQMLEYKWLDIWKNKFLNTCIIIISVLKCVIDTLKVSPKRLHDIFIYIVLFFFFLFFWRNIYSSFDYMNLRENIGRVVVIIQLIMAVACTYKHAG